MIYLRLKRNGSVILNTFPEDFKVENYSEKERGVTYQFVSKGDLVNNFEFFIGNSKQNERLIKSRKNFNVILGIIEPIIELVAKNLKEDTNSILEEYLHNLVKIHGNQKSIIERFTDFDKPQESFNDFVDSVSLKIRNNPDQFAKDICDMSKEIRLMDYHIGGYRLLNDKKTEKSLTKQNLKKFLLGLSHQFFKDLSGNNIYIELNGVSDKIYCLFEYETFNIAMHNFLQNAVKYSKPNSRIHVKTNDSKKQLIFSMDSVKIERDEMENLFEKGVYGKNTPEKFRGDGIGMNTLKKALMRSNITLHIDPEYANNENYNGVEYVRNVFRFNFPENSYFL